MNKCDLCGKVNYQDTTIKNFVFDAYCVSCRGLYNHLVQVKKFAAWKAQKTIKAIYGDHETPVGVFQTEGFTRRTIRLAK